MRLTAQRLRQVLSYDPETGIFRWKIAPRGGFAGAEAGSPMSTGYIMIGVAGGKYLAQRLAWLYMTGDWPTIQVDHRDRVRTNNRWSNLRAATRSQNLANSKIRSDNTSGVRGVSWSKAANKWWALIISNGAYRNLGYFDCIGAAACVRAVEFAKAHREFAQ